MIQKKKNECPKCGKVYVLPSSLKTHLLSHNSDDRYTCSECLMTFLTELQLKEHCKSHVNNKESANEVFYAEVSSDSEDETAVCTLSRKDDTGSTLKELVGIYKKLYKCFECPVTFIEEKDLEYHLASHSYDKGSDQKFPCSSSEELDFTVRKVTKHIEETSSKTVHSTVTHPLSGLVDTDSGKDGDLFPLTNSKESVLRTGSKEEILQTTCSPRDAFRHPKFSTKTYRAAETSVKSVSCQGSQPRAYNSRSAKALSESRFENHTPSALDLKKNYNAVKLDYERDTLNSVLNFESTSAEEHSILLPGKIAVECKNPCEVSSIHELEEHILKMLGLESRCLSMTSKGNNTVLMENIDENSTLQANLCTDYSILFQCLLCFMIFLDKKEIESHHYLHDSDLSTCAKRFLVPEVDIEKSESSVKEPVLTNLVSMIKESKSSVIAIFGSVFRIYLIKIYQIMYKCLMCPMVFLTVSELRNHFYVHSHDVTINGEIYVGNNASCTHLSNISEVQEPSEKYSHISNIDEDSSTYCPVFQCIECQVFFMEKSELESHASLHAAKSTVKLEASSDSESKSRSTLKDTISSHKSLSITTGSFVCDVCKKVFCDSKKLSDHKRIHGVRRFKCEKCGKKFRSNSHLLKHMQVHAKPYNCSECGKSFKTDYILELHKTEHSDARPHKCNKCGNMFRHRISLILHRYDHLSNGPFNCDICKLSFKNAELLKTHMETHLKANSDEEQPFICTVCDKIFFDIKKYRYHVRCHSDKFTNKCNYCNKSFPDLHVLKQHLRMHTGERPFQCTFCDKKFTFKSSFNNHMDTHANNKLYLCHICGISLNQRSTYYSHMKKHSGVKHHRCNICQKAFFYKGSYNRHMAMHFDKKPYQCETCGKRFKQSAHLKSHILIHTGEKPYQCHKCSKSFTQKVSLSNHLLIHKEGQYECPECGRRVKQKSTLFRHLKQKLDGKSYWCKLCDKLFTRRSCLIHHKKSHPQDGCLMKFDGHEEIVRTFVGSCDEQAGNATQIDPFSLGEDVIVTQGIPYDAQEEVIVMNGDTLTVNEDILLNQEITYDGHEEIIITPIDLLETDEESLQVHLVF